MNKKIVTILIAAMALGLVGCGASKEKLNELQSYREQLSAARQAAEETYLDITDSSKRAKLDELAQRADEIEAVDFSRMNDKKIDEYLPEIQEVIDSYSDIQGYLDNTLDSENNANKEAAMNLQVDAYAINKTGMNLKEIVLHDITKDTYSANLMGDEVILNSGYTLMGLVLEIRLDSSKWEFVVKDENDTSYTLVCDSLIEYAKDGVSMTLHYDKELQSGYVDFGNYTRTAEEVASEASTEQDSGEDSSDAMLSK